MFATPRLSKPADVSRSCTVAILTNDRRLSHQLAHSQAPATWRQAPATPRGIDAVRTLQPEVVIVDLANIGTEVISVTVRAASKCQVLAYSKGQSQPGVILASLSAGARAFCTCPESIPSAIAALKSDGFYFDLKAGAALQACSSNSVQTAESDEIQLSQKHKLILELAARGFANKEIAARTQTSESSVKLAMSIIFEKLYAANRSHAVARAYELGILKVGELADALQ